jgi:predicted enzyme related to lactoylglutathione lyase
MARVTGIGGIFFKSSHPDDLCGWYEKHLGIQPSPGTAANNPSAVFEWQDAANSEQKGMTIWALFPADSKYFATSRSPFMVNYRVDDLDELLAQLKAAGVQVDPHRDDYDYGRFAWVYDPEGNRIELWEPTKKS